MLKAKKKQIHMLPDPQLIVCNRKSCKIQHSMVHCPTLIWWRIGWCRAAWGVYRILIPRKIWQFVLSIHFDCDHSLVTFQLLGYL
jgi:hypothetical protein